MIINNIEYREIADHFNEYFVSSIKEIRDKIEHVKYVDQQNMINSRFKFRAISNFETICKDTKRKADYNSVNIKMVLDNWNTIGDILLKIINKSLETGIFPGNWTTSMTTPVEKVSKTNMKKISRKNNKKQLEQYLESNILSKSKGLGNDIHAKQR